MDNVADFKTYRNIAVAMFSVLKSSILVTQEAGEPEFSYQMYKDFDIAQYNVPPGFDMNANQVTYRTGFHEPGHEFDAYLVKHTNGSHRNAFMAFIGNPNTWDQQKAYSATLPYPQSWQADPGEMWADTFADAVAGDRKVGEAQDALAARKFFLSYLPVAPAPAPTPTPTPSKTYRRMYDALYASNIPAGTTLAAGYVDGSHPWSAEDFAKFPTVVKICVFNDRFDADVIDIEGGNNDAHGAVPWIKGKWDRGQTPVVYCYSDAGPVGYRISDIRAACDAAGVKYPLFWITRATDPSTFDPSGDPSIVALQYEFDGTYDVSIVSDTWPKGEIVTEVMTQDEFNAMALAWWKSVQGPETLDAIKAVKADKTHTHDTGPAKE